MNVSAGEAKAAAAPGDGPGKKRRTEEKAPPSQPSGNRGGRGGGGGARGRGQQAGNNNNYNNNNNGQQLPPRYVDLMTVVLQQAREIAMISASIWITILVPTENPFVVAAADVGRQYNEQVREAKQQRPPAPHGLGSPHLHTWNAWMEMVEADRDLPSPARREIDEYMRTIGESMEATAENIAVAKCQKCRDPEWHRVVLQHTPAVARITDILAEKLISMGAVRKDGAGPRGPRERRMADWLNSRQGRAADGAADDD